MKRLFLVMVGLISLSLIAPNAFAQPCNSIQMAPGVYVKGNVIVDGLPSAIPTTVTVTWFRIGGVDCPATNFNFTYPKSAGTSTYELEWFRLNNSVEYVMNVCVAASATIGGNTVTGTGGFSGATPGCANSETVPAGSFGQLHAADILGFLDLIQH